MGTEESKSQVEHNGDQHVDIINLQNVHTGKFEENKCILWIILGIVAVNLIITLLNELNKILNNKATKRAQSMVELRKVAVQE